MGKLALMTTSLHNGWIIPEWTLSDRLRKSREVAGLTQNELAERLDMTRRTIGSYESGERAPKRTTIAAWAMSTAVPVEWLVTGTAPSPDGEGAGIVRHQGLEPRTRWLVAEGEQPAEVIDISRAA